MRKYAPISLNEPYFDFEAVVVFLLLVEGIHIGSCKIYAIIGSRALEKALGKVPVAVGRKRKDNLFCNTKEVATVIKSDECIDQNR